jgi:hypothetical protein
MQLLNFLEPIITLHPWVNHNADKKRKREEKHQKENGEGIVSVHALQPF